MCEDVQDASLDIIACAMSAAGVKLDVLGEFDIMPARDAAPRLVATAHPAAH
jgi:hypothetical protein